MDRTNSIRSGSSSTENIGFSEFDNENSSGSDVSVEMTQKDAQAGPIIYSAAQGLENDYFARVAKKIKLKKMKTP